MTDDRNIKGHVSLLIAYMIFGLNTPVAKEALTGSGVSAVALTFYRFSGAAALFWIVSIFIPREKVSGRDLLQIAAASLFGVFLNQYPFIVGLSLTSPINASVIVTTTPIITMFLAALFLKEPITGTKIAGIFAGAAGALLLIFTGGHAGGGGESGVAGNALCLLSSLSFAVYLSAFKPLISRYTPITLMKWMFLIGTVISLPFCWTGVAAVDYAALPTGTYLRIGYVVGLATFLAYLLIPIGQKRLRPTVVSMYNYMQPIVSSLVAVTLGMDSFGWLKGVATALVFAGVYIVTRSKSRAQMDME